MLWAVAPIMSVVIGTSGFTMLAADVFHWIVTGSWSAATLRNLIDQIGFTHVEAPDLRHPIAGVPLSLVFIMAAPLLFVVTVKIAERLGVDFS